MIMFRFELQGEVKEYLLREELKAGRIAAIITALIFIIPALIIGIVWYDNWIALIISIGTIFWACIFGVILMRFGNPKNYIDKVIPTTITIEKDKIERVGLENYRIFDLTDIKEVWDMGSFYAVIFYFPNNKDRRFVCQKDLIVEGTIEEFEKLFEDKIVRKYEAKD